MSAPGRARWVAAAGPLATMLPRRAFRECRPLSGNCCWLTSTLLADDGGAVAPGLEARIAHAAPVPAEEPEFTLKNRGRRFRHRLVTEVAYRRPCRRRRRRRAARSYQSVATVGNFAEMFAGVKEVDRLLVGPEPFEKRPVVGAAAATSFRSGRTFRATSAASSAVVFPVSGPKLNVFRRVPSAPLTVPLDAQHASPSRRSGTPSSETARRLAPFPPRGSWPSLPSPPAPARPRQTDAQLDDGVIPPSL